MEPTYLIDGRLVQAKECLVLELALTGPTYTNRPQLFGRKMEWYVECQCCDSSGEHSWSPSGHGGDPDGGNYSCGPCAGLGTFKIQMP